MDGELIERGLVHQLLGINLFHEMVVRVGIWATHEYCLLLLKPHLLVVVIVDETEIVHVIIMIFVNLLLLFLVPSVVKVFFAFLLREEGCLQRVSGERLLSYRLIVNPSWFKHIILFRPI